MCITREQEILEKKFMDTMEKVVFEAGITSMRVLQHPRHAALRDELGTDFWLWACAVPLAMGKCHPLLYSLGMKADEAADEWYRRFFPRLLIRGVRSAKELRNASFRHDAGNKAWKFDRVFATVQRDGAGAAIRMLMVSAVRFCIDLQRESKRRSQPLNTIALEDAPFITHSAPDDAPDMRCERKHASGQLLKCLNACDLKTFCARLGDALGFTMKEVAGRMLMDCTGFVDELIDELAFLLGVRNDVCHAMLAHVKAEAAAFHPHGSDDPDDDPHVLVAALYRKTSRKKRAMFKLEYCRALAS